MLSAKQMSEKIRMKRKQVKEEGVDNLLDTAPLPQMNPQDVHNLKMNAQIDETLGTEDKPEGPEDPADEDISGTSQEKSSLAKKMARLKSVFNRLG